MHSSYVSKCITSDLVAWKRRKTSAKKKIGVKEKQKEEKTNFHGIVNIFWEKERTTDSNTTACEIEMPDFCIVKL